MSALSPEHRQLLAKYVAHARAVQRGMWNDEGLDSAYELSDPDAAWKVVAEAVGESGDDRMLAYVAAGPLEDLLKRNGLDLIDKIEVRAKTDARLRKALTGVWIDERDVPQELLDRLAKIVEGEESL